MIMFLLVMFAAVIGAAWREIYTLQRKVMLLVRKTAPKAATGPTPGTYLPANETKQTDHVIMPKSPARVEWEANMRTKEENGLVDSTWRRL